MKNVNKAMATAISTGSNYRKELQAAVQSYNAAEHSITKIPPEEVLTGRKIRRGLPLLNYDRSGHEEKLLDERDREAKLLSKKREDIRRGAKPNKVKPGDTVIVERPSRGKGDSRFGAKRFTVMQERNGSLILCDSDGQQLKRHVSQTKKVQQWRNSSSSNAAKESSVPVSSANDASREQTLSSKASKKSSVSVSPASDISRERPERKKRPPSYLTEYTRTLEGNLFGSST